MPLEKLGTDILAALCNVPAPPERAKDSHSLGWACPTKASVHGAHGRTDIGGHRSLCNVPYVRLKFCHWQNLDRIFAQSEFLLQGGKIFRLNLRYGFLRQSPKQWDGHCLGIVHCVTSRISVLQIGQNPDSCKMSYASFPRGKLGGGGRSVSGCKSNATAALPF